MNNEFDIAIVGMAGHRKNWGGRYYAISGRRLTSNPKTQEML